MDAGEKPGERTVSEKKGINWRPIVIVFLVIIVGIFLFFLLQAMLISNVGYSGNAVQAGNNPQTLSPSLQLLGAIALLVILSLGVIFAGWLFLADRKKEDGEQKVIWPAVLFAFVL